MEQRKSTYTHDHVCIAASMLGIETQVLMLAQEALLPMECLLLFYLFSSSYFRCPFYSNERGNKGCGWESGSIREELGERKP